MIRSSEAGNTHAIGPDFAIPFNATDCTMNDLNDSYAIIIDQDVRWGDMDAFAHVNNTVYFKYFEDARIEFFNRYGISRYLVEHNIGPILAATHCNFKLPLTYPDRIHIGMKFSVLSPKKINTEYAVYSEKLDAIVAQGEGLLVYYDYNQLASCEIPDGVQQGLFK